jgi:uncharacterized protein (TIGR00288 family)
MIDTAAGERESTRRFHSALKLAVDALEICHTRPHIDTFALLCGEGDFSPVIAKLQEANKRVVISGPRKALAPQLIDLADEYLPWEPVR